MELVHITIKLLSAQAARMPFKVRCSLLLQIQIGLHSSKYLQYVFPKTSNNSSLFNPTVGISKHLYHTVSYFISKTNN